MACNLSYMVKNEGVLKVTVSHMHFKSGSISGTELDRVGYMYVIQLSRVV